MIGSPLAGAPLASFFLLSALSGADTYHMTIDLSNGLEASVKQNDDGFRLYDVMSFGGVPLNLTGATLALILRRDGVAAFTKYPGVTSPSPLIGAVQLIAPLGGFTAGKYQLEWEATFSTGRVLTHPANTYRVLNVLHDLDRP
jgi:hypothetical protein